MMSKICSDKVSIIILVFLLTSCRSFTPVRHESLQIKLNSTQATDSTVLRYYLPYKDSLDKLLKFPVAELENDLSKKQPESSLGNLMADIMKIKTEQYSERKIDVGIVNFGGIRVGALKKGVLHIEDAYFIMPFDNYLVVQELSGQQLKDLCDSIAIKNGWPVSGISFQIKNNKAINIMVDNQPLDNQKTYTIALSDYVANGGDGMTLLKSIPQVQTGKLYRDAILEYWSEQSKSGKKISSAIENRITYAE